MNGIAFSNGIYSVFEYLDQQNVPKEVLIPYPAHHNIADLIIPRVHFLNPDIRFEWKASWSYYQLPVLTIFYQDIVVQRVLNASADVVVFFLAEYLNIELSTIRERQVHTLWKENESLKSKLELAKSEKESIAKLYATLLAKLKST